MGAHLIDGEFQSDKYPTTPRGKVPLSCKDPMAQDLLWQYAQRRRVVDAEFSDDLEQALKIAGFQQVPTAEPTADVLEVVVAALRTDDDESDRYLRDQSKHVLEALAEAGYVVERGWQDISSAPKDGRRILGFDPKIGTVTVAWATADRAFNNPIIKALAGNDGYWKLAGSAFNARPTHWRPLPSNPTRRDGERGMNVWCVEHREGTCAVKSGRKPAEGTDSVETKCGHFVILPFGYEKAEPTCEECRCNGTKDE